MNEQYYCWCYFALNCLCHWNKNNNKYCVYLFVYHYSSCCYDLWLYYGINIPTRRHAEVTCLCPTNTAAAGVTARACAPLLKLKNISEKVKPFTCAHLVAGDRRLISICLCRVDAAKPRRSSGAQTKSLGRSAGRTRASCHDKHFTFSSDQDAGGRSCRRLVGTASAHEHRNLISSQQAKVWTQRNVFGSSASNVILLRHKRI